MQLELSPIASKLLRPSKHKSFHNGASQWPTLRGPRALHGARAVAGQSKSTLMF